MKTMCRNNDQDFDTHFVYTLDRHLDLQVQILTLLERYNELKGELVNVTRII